MGDARENEPPEKYGTILQGEDTIGKRLPPEHDTDTRGKEVRK